MTTMRSPSPTTATEEKADGRFFPTDTHQLTPYASPVSKKRCFEIDVSVFSYPLDNDRDFNNEQASSDVMTPDLMATPLRCYMPRRVSGHGAITNFSSLDGDVTPPLHPNPTIQIVSPSALPLELCCEGRYQESSSLKRKRAAEAREEAIASSLPPRILTAKPLSPLVEIPMLPLLSAKLESHTSSRMPRQPLRRPSTPFRRSIPSLPEA